MELVEVKYYTVFVAKQPAIVVKFEDKNKRDIFSPEN